MDLRSKVESLTRGTASYSHSYAFVTKLYNLISVCARWPAHVGPGYCCYRI